MGYFTFTFADKKLRYTKDGDYHRACLLGYDGRNTGYIAYPDGSFSPQERNYSGYGIIAGKDVFELVAEWNRPWMEECLVEIAKKGRGVLLSNRLLRIGKAWQENDMERISQILSEIDTDRCVTPETDWKRTLGILLIDEQERCPQIRYPLKIVSSNKNGYDKIKSVSQLAQ